MVIQQYWIQYTVLGSKLKPKLNKCEGLGLCGSNNAGGLQ